MAPEAGNPVAPATGIPVAHLGLPPVPQFLLQSAGAGSTPAPAEAAPAASPAPAVAPAPAAYQAPAAYPAPTASPAPSAAGAPRLSAPPTPRGRTRMAVVVGVIAAVLVVAAGTITTLALRPAADEARLSAQPTPRASGAVALDAGPESGSGQPGSERAGTEQPGTESAGSDPAGSDPADSDDDPATGAPSPPDRGEGATTETAPAAPPARDEPSPEAPRSEAPATRAPATKAPATKAPATKAPATKAPAKKAPEIDKAVAKSGTRGAGPCSAKLVGGYGCLQTYGDVWWVYDTKADSHSAVVFWEVGNRSGQCANSMGHGKIGACNKNYAEGSTGRAKVCIMDWDTKQMHGCTAYFSFKTS